VTAMLEISRLEVRYGSVAAVRGISLIAEEGTVVTLLGANGAGKSSTLRAISGLVEPTAGSIRFDGRELVGMSAEAIARLGVAHVPEGRGIFPGLTVTENLRMARYGVPRQGAAAATEEVLTYFPILKEKARQAAGSMSGGQQQQLAIARALLQKPRLLLLDEPSLGLAPLVVAEVLAVVAGLKSTGIAVVLVEQFIREALKVADRAAVLEQGHIVLEGAVADLSESRIAGAYLGGEKVELGRAPMTAGRGVERVQLNLAGLRVRELERAANSSGKTVDEVVDGAIDRALKQPKARAPRRRKR
jgi:branched-chain amino acid transport system ATP-binding protein